MKIRLIIYTIFFLSLLCSLLSFFALSEVMLPYQDATQDMLTEQENEINFWSFSLLSSLGSVDLSSLFLQQFVGYLYKAEPM